MRAWLFRQVAGWSVLVLLLVGGMIAMITLVETWGRGDSVLDTVCPMLVALWPLFVAVGAALARIRADHSGAALAWSVAGWGLPRTGPVVLGVGLLWGLGSAVVERAGEHAWHAPVSEEWTWSESTALGHGFQVRPVDGRIAVRPAPENWKQAVVESPLSGHRRGARVLGCALFALFGWWPISRTAPVQLGIVFGLGFSSQLCEIMLRASAEAGGLHPIVGAWVGVGFGALLLLCLAAPRYFTRNQKPV